VTSPVRANELTSGFLANVFVRGLRVAAAILLARVFIGRMGLDAWGMFGLVAATIDFATLLDLAVAELFGFEAAQCDTAEEVRDRLGQAVWLLLPPSLFGAGLLLVLAAASSAGWFAATGGQGALIARLFLVGIVGYPFLLVANALISAAQGLGHLRSASRMFAVTVLLEVGIVLVGLYLGWDLLRIQWARTVGNVVRVVWLGAICVRAGIPLPWPRAPRLERLRAMARYCLGYSVTKALAAAMTRATLPLSQGFASAAALGSFDAADRWASPIIRLASPVSDALFPFLVRGLSEGASAADRERARRAFLGGTLLLTAFAAVYTILLTVLGPLVLSRWFGREIGALTASLVPFILAAWSLNVVAAMGMAVLLGTRRARVSNLVHGGAFAVQLALLLWLGPRLGVSIMLLAPVVANALLAVGLVLAACPVVGVSASRVLSSLALVFAPVGIAALARAHVANPLALLGLAGACAFASVALALVTTRELRALVAERLRGRSEP